MSGGCMRGAKPPRVDPNASPSAGAVLPTHTVPTTRPRNGKAAFFLASLASVIAVLFVCAFGFWMDPVVSIDSISAAGLDNASAAAAPTFQVKVSLRTRWFHLLPSRYENGSIAISCAGGAVTAADTLEDVEVTPFDPAVLVVGPVRARPTALSGAARELLRGEARRGQVQLDVSMAYQRAGMIPPYRGFRVRCAPTLPAQGDATASCAVVK